jgi:hypothetical protein
MPRDLQVYEFCGNHVDSTCLATRIIRRQSRRVTNAFQSATLLIRIPAAVLPYTAPCDSQEQTSRCRRSHMSENLPFLAPNSLLPSVSKTSSWERHIDRAMAESDPTKLLSLIHRAEEALFLRWQEITDDPSDKNEREAMNAACENLRQFTIHKLGWPNQVLGE